MEDNETDKRKQFLFSMSSPLPLQLSTLQLNVLFDFYFPLSSSQEPKEDEGR